MSYVKYIVGILRNYKEKGPLSGFNGQVLDWIYISQIIK